MILTPLNNQYCGIITPFHNMMLISPVTTDEDIGRLIQGWGGCIAELAEVGTYDR